MHLPLFVEIFESYLWHYEQVRFESRQGCLDSPTLIGLSARIARVMCSQVLCGRRRGGGIN
eukprot:3026064-Pleurochrysis_carterae.AAC.2